METQAKITEKEGWVRVLDIEVPTEEVEKAFSRVTEKYKQQAEIPGFRAGKAPIEMIRARYGQAIRQETLEELLPNAYKQAVLDNKLFPVSDPAIENVVFERNQPLTFTVEITVRPEVEVVNYRGLKLKRQVWEVTDEDVNQQIERFREVKAELIDVPGPVEAGNVILCDLQKIHDKFNRITESKFEGRMIDLVEERCAPELLRELPGMKIGEGKEIEVVYPPDHPEPKFAGNTVLFRAWVKGIKHKKLPPVDDEFAHNLGDFSDLEDLKTKVRADIERNVKQEENKDLREQARKKVVEVNKFEVPPTVMEDYLKSVTERFKTMGGQLDEAKIRAEFGPLAEEQFQWDYIMHEIAKMEKLAVSDGEAAAVRKLIEEGRAQSDKEQQAEINEEKLRTEILEQKVYEFLVENAETEDVPRMLTSRIIQP